MIPASILRIWFFGLFSFVLVGGGIYTAHKWYQRAWDYDFDLHRSYFAPHLGNNHETWLLALAAGLILWALAGRFILQGILMLILSKNRKKATEGNLLKPEEGATVKRLKRPDGSELEIECSGRESDPLLILTHGWGANRREWDYLKKELGDEFQLVTWDLPGLGKSTQPGNRDFSIEKMARDLAAVLDFMGEKPALLLGHSIGGMITLTFCRLFPQVLETRVTGIVLVQTTYINPLHTTKMGSLLSALQGPVIVPLLHLTIWFSPIVWLMNWLSYLNGSALVSTHSSGFAGTETGEELQFVARFQPIANPAVMARGMMGMLKLEESATLGSIQIPCLVVSGDRDPVCKPEASARMQEEIPKAELAVLAPARHMGLIEHHGRFSAIVREFSSPLVGHSTESMSRV